MLGKNSLSPEFTSCFLLYEKEIFLVPSKPKDVEFSDVRKVSGDIGNSNFKSNIVASNDIVS